MSPEQINAALIVAFAGVGVAFANFIVGMLKARGQGMQLEVKREQITTEMAQDYFLRSKASTDREIQLSRGNAELRILVADLESQIKILRMEMETNLRLMRMELDQTHAQLDSERAQAGRLKQQLADAQLEKYRFTEQIAEKDRRILELEQTVQKLQSERVIVDAA